MNAIEKHILSGTLSQYSREQERTLNIYKISCWVLFALMLIFGNYWLSMSQMYKEVKRDAIYLKAENDCLKKEIVKAQNYINSIQPKSYKH